MLRTVTIDSVAYDIDEFGGTVSPGDEANEYLFAIYGKDSVKGTKNPLLSEASVSIECNAGAVVFSVSEVRKYEDVEHVDWLVRCSAKSSTLPLFPGLVLVDGAGQSYTWEESGWSLNG